MIAIVIVYIYIDIINFAFSFFFFYAYPKAEGNEWIMIVMYKKIIIIKKIKKIDILNLMNYIVK